MPVCFELHKTHPAIQPVWLHKIDHKDLMLQKVGIQYSPADLGLKHLDGSRMLECWWLYNRKITGWRTQDDVVLGECTQKGHPTVPASISSDYSSWPWIQCRYGFGWRGGPISYKVWWYHGLAVPILCPHCLWCLQFVHDVVQKWGPSKTK